MCAVLYKEEQETGKEIAYRVVLMAQMRNPCILVVQILERKR
jgi:hypothetical protein